MDNFNMAELAFAKDQIVEGVISVCSHFGCLVTLPQQEIGILDILRLLRENADEYQMLKAGDILKVRILGYRKVSEEFELSLVSRVAADS